MSNTSPESSEESQSGSSAPVERAGPTPVADAQSEASGPPEARDAGESTGRPKIQVGKSNLGPRPAPPAGRDSGPRRPGPRPPRGPQRRNEEQKEGDQAEGEKRPPLFVNTPRANVPVPSKREKSNPDLEAELNEALGDLSLDQIVEDGTASRAT